MSILKQLFSWGKHGKENGFHWENTGFGLRFRFPVSWKKERFQEGLATYQYLVLQPVSYTHLDVYKRQGIVGMGGMY